MKDKGSKKRRKRLKKMHLRRRAKALEKALVEEKDRYQKLVSHHNESCICLDIY